MAKQILQRYGTAAQLATTAGTNREIALEVDGSGIATGQIRVMDGVTDGGFIASLPAGMILSFANSTAPDGFLECNGASLSRASYVRLFSAIGTTWGDGDDAGNTFALPDLRGAFLRGAGTGSINSRDKIGGDVGSFQEDKFQGHFHKIYTNPPGGVYSNSSTILITNSSPFNSSQKTEIGTWNFKVVEEPKEGANGDPRFGDETFPYNASILYCIKY